MVRNTHVSDMLDGFLPEEQERIENDLNRFDRQNQTLIDYFLILPPSSVIISAMAKFKMKKLGVVLIYELVRIVIHVNMFPGIPKMDTML